MCSDESQSSSSTTTSQAWLVLPSKTRGYLKLFAILWFGMWAVLLLDLEMDKIEKQTCSGKKTSFPDWESNPSRSSSESAES
jgi:hypothetical protein